MSAYKELTPVRYDDSGVRILRRFAFRPGEHCFAVHWHDRMELLVIQEGSLDFYRNEQHAATVHAGEVAITGPRQPHSAVAGPTGVIYDVVMFEVDAFLSPPPITARLLRPLLEGRVDLRPVSGELWATANLIVSLASQRPLEVVGHVYQLLGQLMASCVVSIHETGAADRRFHEVVAYVNRHYTEPLTTAMLSSHFGYSEAYFCRLFKKATGLNALRYVEVLRLDMAQKLLMETDMEISRIAAKCGFEDVCYFSHRFHRHVGRSPTAFRRECPTAAEG